MTTFERILNRFEREAKLLRNPPRNVIEIDNDSLSALISSTTAAAVAPSSSNSTTQNVEQGVKSQYSRQWVVNSTAVGFPQGCSDIVLQLLEISDDESLYITSLIDIVGQEHSDLYKQVWNHRREILESPPAGEPERQDMIVSHPIGTDSAMITSGGAPDASGPFLTSKQRRIQAENTRRQLESQQLTMKEKTAQYPHVYGNQPAGSTLSAFGTKFVLPLGTQRTSEEYFEQIYIPASVRNREQQRKRKLLSVSSLDTLCRGTFSKYDNLNTMQSLVYPVAYETNENMLVCAPTGAGKTDVALLTMLSTIRQYTTFSVEGDVDVNYEDFKIVYVAPLKALAAEIVVKMGSRLSWLGINVRELTGDMQLTRAEIAATQIIVTTPEKWDVVTRKSSADTELIDKLRLLVIDEVHLLHEDRGAVIESLVSRTLRRVETSQSMIRIVGLSATLPNYVDVAEFLGVNPYAGLFYFDSSFRPVPLQQYFVGVAGKAGSRLAIDNVERAAYDKLIEAIETGKQALVFVHSRKDTVKTARAIAQMAEKNGDSLLFDCSDTKEFVHYEKEVARHTTSKELFKNGLSVHNAGMLRSERTLTEKLFASGAVRVMVCTATLAWGVNLPAATVIIKGTQMYDAAKGGFTDLGISDVIQIFGRAGRPQFENVGTGVLITTSDRLDHYVSLITQQHPIESKLLSKLGDNLNAEIALGTVSSVDEAVSWLGYTYLYVRMRKNPLGYGLSWQELEQDPLLGGQRRKLIIEAARKLHMSQMIVFDEQTGTFICKDVGRIASEFYLLSESVDKFNESVNMLNTPGELLATISGSGEFDGIRLRNEEAQEIEKLMDVKSNAVRYPVSKGSKLDSSSAMKVETLLQSYISRKEINDSALTSDMLYVAQNATRIARAFLMIAINRRWGPTAETLLDICKEIEAREWADDSYSASYAAIMQVVETMISSGIHGKSMNELKAAINRYLAFGHNDLEVLREMSAKELGELIHNIRLGGQLKRVLDRVPCVYSEIEVLPLTKNVLRIRAIIGPDFQWDVKVHGRMSSYWLWVTHESGEILHSERVTLQRSEEDDKIVEFSVPVYDPLPDHLTLSIISDYFVGISARQDIPLGRVVRPENESIVTKLQRLRPLPVEALENDILIDFYRKKFSFFNPMQTMGFHVLYHMKTNVFLGSPTGSGKTNACELALWAALRDRPGSKIIYIAPMKALVRERVTEWTKGLCANTGIRLSELTGDTNPSSEEIKQASIIVTTPEKFDGISRNWRTRLFVQNVSLIIMDEIHLLASDRGAVLEMIVSRMSQMQKKDTRPPRILGMSTAVANATDLASWLHIDSSAGLLNFPPSIRPVPLEMYIEGFPDNLGFCPLMNSMNKPLFQAIKRHSPEKPVLVFVASRRQTRLTAQELIRLCGTEENPRRFVRMNDEELSSVIPSVQDETLRLSLQFGIALHHAGLVDSDRKISHHLFEQNKVQILVATATLAWGVNLPAYLVVVKGTQYFDAKTNKYVDMDLTDVLQMMGRAGRPAFDTSGVALVYTKDSTKQFYKYFLNTGFPVESSLHKFLPDHLGAELSNGDIKSKSDALEWLKWTFLWRRVQQNPTYYGVGRDEERNDSDNEDLNGEETSLRSLQITPEQVVAWVCKLIDSALDTLEDAGCAVCDAGGAVRPTKFLRIASQYYVSYKTMKSFLNEFEPAMTFQQCLRMLALASEYDELAIRHNEDLANEELSKLVRYPGQDLNLRMVDPHVKAYLLVQAHLEQGVQLPISDYAQDMIAVLDQSLRIIQVCIDTCAELGYRDSCLQFISLMQCIKQGTWPENHVRLIPGYRAKKLSKDNDNFQCIAEHGKDAELVNKVIVKKAHAAFQRKIAKIPLLNVSIELKAKGAGVDVLLAHKHSNIRAKLDCPRFPKSQLEGWIAMSCRDGVIVELHRIGAPKKGQTVAFHDAADEIIITCDGMDLTYGFALKGNKWMPVEKKVVEAEVKLDE